MRKYAIYVNKSDGLGWVRGFKKTYQTREDADKAAKRFKRYQVIGTK